MPTTRDAVWSLNHEQVLKHFKTSSAGLSAREAVRRLKTYGPNVLSRHRPLTRIKIVLNQLKSPLTVLLLAAAGLTVFLREWIDAGVILAAILVNTTLGFWQEHKAEHVLDELQSYIRTRVRVRRDDNDHEMDAEELVPGDIIRLSQGDRVPADARVFFAAQAGVDESVLTGESLPVTKITDPLDRDTSLAERTNMVWSGTLVVEGILEAVVVATGPRTEFGRIAALTKRAPPERTPLQRAVGRFALQAGLVIGLLALALFAGGVFTGYGAKDMFLLAVAVAVSAVPEGLPIALTVILAIGVERLAKRKGVVRKLLAAETLGSASLILTDKTGTLTLARMSLAAVVPHGQTGPQAEHHLLEQAVLTADVAIENPEAAPDVWNVIGRPMESALVREAASRGVSLVDAMERSPVRERVPFNSERKYSSVTVGDGKKTCTFLMGAPEIIGEMCRMESRERTELFDQVERRAESGERVIGLARREADGEAVFSGLLAFRDPIRPSVKDAIRRIRAAGVRTVIVTGDHRGTAESVARELGLLEEGMEVMTGREMASLSEAELEARLDRLAVVARTTPEQKMQLVRLFKKRGETVAVTGDGVNDAPALEAADIGVAVGSGTEVAKSAADLVVLDDNFATLVVAIEEGRRILQNIRKAIVYLLSNSLDELFLIGGALLAGLALPLNALQILFVNFFSDSFPAIAFAFEKGVPGEPSTRMKVGAGILDRHVRFLIFVVGALSSAFLFILYVSLLRAGYAPPLVRTFIFAAFATYTLLVSFALRSLHVSIFRYNPFANRSVTAGVGVGILLTILAVEWPVLQSVLSTVSLPIRWWVGVFAVGLCNIGAIELAKALFRRRVG